MSLLYEHELLLIFLIDQVKNEVMNQPSEYEVVGFIFEKFKKAIGQSRVMKGVIKKKEHRKKEEESNEKKLPVNQGVNELPDKVDK